MDAFKARFEFYSKKSRGQSFVIDLTAESLPSGLKFVKLLADVPQTWRRGAILNSPTLFLRTVHVPLLTCTA
jgi:hypothetical protein